MRLAARGQEFAAHTGNAPPDDEDDLTAEEREALEDTLTETATAAVTIAE